jgi:hypothetical protein
MSTGSSSKRKRFQPQRQLMKVNSFDACDEQPPILSKPCEVEKEELNTIEEEEPTSTAEVSSQPMDTIAAHLNTNFTQQPADMNKFREILELQRRMYANFNQQPQPATPNGRPEEEDSPQIREAMLRDFKRLMGKLNENFVAFNMAIQKVNLMRLKH